MAKLSMKLKQQAPAKFSSRRYNRCNRDNRGSAAGRGKAHTDRTALVAGADSVYRRADIDFGRGSAPEKG